MKKIILSALVLGATLMAADAPMYKSGVLLPANAEAIYKKECTQCHGADGKQTSFSGGSKIEYKAISGMDAGKLAKELQQYRLGYVNKYGYGMLMKTRLTDLSYEEMDALSEYISTTVK